MGVIVSHEGKEPIVDESVFIASSAYVIGDVVIGENSSVWFNSVIRGDVNYIRIGKFTNIQDLSVVHVTSKKFPTHIGDYVTIGHRAIIHGCTIGNYCLIGMGAIILDGVEVSDYTIVAAGSVVTPGKKFPPGVLLMGIPAKIVREITLEERKNIEESAIHYVELAKSYKLG
ncbi:MAG: gamma carbonic anhydrase family protein [Thermosulfidibacteraceae bacterium]